LVYLTIFIVFYNTLDYMIDNHYELVVFTINPLQGCDCKRTLVTRPSLLYNHCEHSHRRHGQCLDGPSWVVGLIYLHNQFRLNKIVNKIIYN